MSNYIETPKTLNVDNMFIWWCKEKIRKKRHLRIKYQTSHAKDTILVSKNGEELKWLVKHIDVLQEQILKLELLEKGKMYFTNNILKIYSMRTELHECKKRIEHLKNVNLQTEHVIISDKVFKEVVYTYNKKVRERLVHNGEVINMKQYLGYLYIQKIPRNHPNFVSKGDKQVNWNASKEYRKELTAKGIQVKDDQHPDGKNWFVYYTDDYFLRVAWTKKWGACRVKNHGYYAFYPCKGPGGFTKQLSHANQKFPLLHKRYINRKIYYPSLPSKRKSA